MNEENLFYQVEKISIKSQNERLVLEVKMEPNCSITEELKKLVHKSLMCTKYELMRENLYFVFYRVNNLSNNTKLAYSVSLSSIRNAFPWESKVAPIEEQSYIENLLCYENYFLQKAKNKIINKIIDMEQEQDQDQDQDQA